MTDKYFYELNYKHHCDNIQIGVDDTDHLVFICDNCKKPLEVIKVESKKIVVSMDGKDKDHCTWVTCVCHNCKTLGIRKFYWNEDGKYCWQRTYKEEDTQERK